MLILGALSMIEDAQAFTGAGDLGNWSLDLCSSKLAEPCHSFLTISDNPIVDPFYEAAIYIESNGTVANGISVKFDAGQYIDLLSGFEVKSNAIFEAVVEGGCN